MQMDFGIGDKRSREPGPRQITSSKELAHKSAPKTITTTSGLGRQVQKCHRTSKGKLGAAKIANDDQANCQAKLTTTTTTTTTTSRFARRPLGARRAGAVRFSCHNSSLWRLIPLGLFAGNSTTSKSALILLLLAATSTLLALQKSHPSPAESRNNQPNEINRTQTNDIDENNYNNEPINLAENLKTSGEFRNANNELQQNNNNNNNNVSRPADYSTKTITVDRDNNTNGDNKQAKATNHLEQQREQHKHHYHHRNNNAASQRRKAPRGFCTHISRILAPNARCYAHLVAAKNHNLAQNNPDSGGKLSSATRDEELVYVRLETLGSKLSDLNTLAINERLLASLFHQLLELSQDNNQTNPKPASSASQTTTITPSDQLNSGATTNTIDELKMQILGEQDEPSGHSKRTNLNSHNKCRLAMEKFLCRLVYPTCHFRRRDISALVRPPCRQDCLLLRDSLCPNLDWPLFAKALSLALSRALSLLPISSEQYPAEAPNLPPELPPSRLNTNSTALTSTRGYNLKPAIGGLVSGPANTHFYWPHEKSIEHCESLPAHIQEQLHQYEAQNQDLASSDRLDQKQERQLNVVKAEARSVQNATEAELLELHNNKLSIAHDNGQFADAARAITQEPILTRIASRRRQAPKSNQTNSAAAAANSFDGHPNNSTINQDENEGDKLIYNNNNNNTNDLLKTQTNNKLNTKTNLAYENHKQHSKTVFDGHKEQLKFASWPSCSNARLSTIGADFKSKVDCLQDEGSNYQGQVNFTNSGIPCQAWREQEPHRHQMSELLFDNMVTVGNHCRNPGGLELMPWCYTKNPKIRWQYCSIKPCDDKQHTIV